jgi:hypothetical protein
MSRLRFLSLSDRVGEPLSTSSTPVTSRASSEVGTFRWSSTSISSAFKSMVELLRQRDDIIWARDAWRKANVDKLGEQVRRASSMTSPLTPASPFALVSPSRSNLLSEPSPSHSDLVSLKNKYGSALHNFGKRARDSYSLLVNPSQRNLGRRPWQSNSPLIM